MAALRFSCRGRCRWRERCFRKLLSWAFPRWVGAMETLSGTWKALWFDCCLPQRGRMGREDAASEIQVAHSRWKAFWGPRTNHEKCSCCWSLDLTEMPFPILYTPWYQLKWLPQLQGTELAWAETNPAQHNWFYDVQWGTQSNWPFCRGNLLAYPASSPPLPEKCYQALFVGPKPDSTASCSLWLALGWCQDEVRVLGHRANAVAVAVGSLPDAFSAHAHLPRESPLSVPYHTVPSFQFPICPQKHRLTHYCSFSAAPQLYQDPQRILR